MPYSQVPSSQRPQKRRKVQQRPEDPYRKSGTIFQMSADDACLFEQRQATPQHFHQTAHQSTGAPSMTGTNPTDSYPRTTLLRANDTFSVTGFDQLRDMGTPMISSDQAFSRAQALNQFVCDREAARGDYHDECMKSFGLVIDHVPHATSYLPSTENSNNVLEQGLYHRQARPINRYRSYSYDEEATFVNGLTGGGLRAHEAGPANVEYEQNPLLAQAPEQSQQDQSGLEPADESFDAHGNMDSMILPCNDSLDLSSEDFGTFEHLQTDDQADDQEYSNSYSHIPQKVEYLNSSCELWDYTSWASGTSVFGDSTESSFGMLPSASSQQSHDRPDWGAFSEQTVRPKHKTGPESVNEHLTESDAASRGGSAASSRSQVRPGTLLNNKYMQSGRFRSHEGPSQHDDLNTHMSPRAPSHGPPSSTSSSFDVLYCRICSTSFTGAYGKGNLGRHMRSLHAGDAKTVACEDDNCESVFARSDARKKHYRKHHPHLAMSTEEKRCQMNQDLRNVWTGSVN